MSLSQSRLTYFDDDCMALFSFCLLYFLSPVVLSLITIQFAGMGGEVNNTRLEANDVEDQLLLVDSAITTMKRAYEQVKEQREKKAQKDAINALVARSHALHAELKALEAKRLTKKPNAASRLAAFLFG